ncbi:MAG TPA: hypothetical protein VND20_04470 [Candidatus Binataceae bacterium]|nr:hypothetical protein [Candidatus Binataceae bacterium]
MDFIVRATKLSPAAAVNPLARRFVGGLPARPDAASPLPPSAPPIFAATAPIAPRRIPSANAIAYLNAIAAMRRLDPQAMAHKYPAWKDYFLRGR